MGESVLTPAFNYYFVAHDRWGAVTSQIGNDDRHQLQYVPEGASVYDTAGKAGSWLGSSGRSLTRLIIVAHGGPGSFTLGEKVTARNVAPLGGWLCSFFEDAAAGITILGCSSAADSVESFGKYEHGHANKPNDGNISHVGYELLRELARASNQTVEGALDGLSIVGLRLRSWCRRVAPNGANQVFDAGGV